MKHSNLQSRHYLLLENISQVIIIVITNFQESAENNLLEYLELNYVCVFMQKMYLNVRKIVSTWRCSGQPRVL